MYTISRALAFLLVAIPILGPAQSPTRSETRLSTHGTFVVDGAHNPELISDRSALRIWLLSVSESSDASPERVAVLQNKLLATHINTGDLPILRLATTHFADQRKIILASYTRSQPQQIRDSKEKLFSDTENAIYGSLSPQGVQEMAKHLLHVKQHMLIGAGPNMAK